MTKLLVNSLPYLLIYLAAKFGGVLSKKIYWATKNKHPPAQATIAANFLLLHHIFIQTSHVL